MRSQVPKSRSRKRECISSEEEEKACALRRKKQRRTITRSESREVPISDSDEETPAEHTTLRPNRKDHNPSMLLVERRQLSLITDHDFSAFFDLGADKTKIIQKRPLRCNKPSNVRSDEDTAVQRLAETRGRSLTPDSPSTDPSQNSAEECSAVHETKTNEREPSLTPPPELAPDCIARLHCMSQTLQNMGKDLEPSELPETDDNPDPDLDVALINDVPSIERSVLDNIVIKVEFKNYPSKTERSKPIKVKVSTSQPFERLMISASQKWGVPDFKTLVFFYNGTQVFRHGTPRSLRMVGRPTLETYMRNEYESALNHNTMVEQQAEADEAALIALKLQSKTAMKKIKLKQSTTVQDLVAYYARDIPDKPVESIRLIFEGETLNPQCTLNQLGLEDGDILEVVGM